MSVGANAGGEDNVEVEAFNVVSWLFRRQI